MKCIEPFGRKKFQCMEKNQTRFVVALQNNQLPVHASMFGDATILLSFFFNHVYFEHVRELKVFAFIKQASF